MVELDSELDYKPAKAPFTQKKSFWCGPAAMQWWLFAVYHRLYGQATLAKQMKTHPLHGTPPEAMARWIKTKTKVGYQCGMDPELCEITLPFIVNYNPDHPEDGGHYGVVQEMEWTTRRRTVTLWEPWFGTSRTHDWGSFEEKWYGSTKESKRWALWAPK